MNCKNCGQELAEDEIICAQCGQDNSPEVEAEPKKRIDPWKIAFPTVVGLCLFLVLAWLLNFGVTGELLLDRLFKENNVRYKESYSVMTGALLEVTHDQVVAKLGEHKLTNGQLRMFYSVALGEWKGKYKANVPLDKQLYDEKSGLTWEQYLLELSLNTWKQFQVVTDMAKEAGFELLDIYQKDLDDLQKNMEASAEKDGYKSINDMLANSVCAGCTFEDYKYYLELYYWNTLYYNELVEKAEVSLEEIEDYYDAHEDEVEQEGFSKDSGILVNFRNILVKPDTLETEITDAEWKACHDLANTIMDNWLKEGKTEEGFAEKATVNSADSQSKNNGGLYEYVTEFYFSSVDVRHILIKVEGTKDENGKTTYTDADWEACRKKAQEIYDGYLAGEQTEENFSALAKEHSGDGNAAQGGIYENVKKNQMVETFDAWIFDESRKPGDTGLVKTEYGYHIMYFVHRDTDMNDWLFDEEREQGDYTLVKTDEGYQLLYYVSGEEGWILYCEISVSLEKVDALIDEQLENNPMKVTYGKVYLGS